MPWDLVGPGGCLPKVTRSCQYGSMPYVEMVAVQMSCAAADAWLAQHEAAFLEPLVEELEAGLGYPSRL